jgi:hypothetical protein
VNWFHGVYETAHIISSRRTELTGFPMPDDCPDFPIAAQMHAYLRSFAAHFGLFEHIGLVVCNGHHWGKRMPDYPGSFAGRARPLQGLQEPRSPARQARARHRRRQLGV